MSFRTGAIAPLAHGFRPRHDCVYGLETVLLLVTLAALTPFRADAGGEPGPAVATRPSGAGLRPPDRTP